MSGVNKKIEKIRNDIQRTGFPTEIEIGNILEKNNWIVGNQWPYLDKVSQKIRPVDILALRIGMQQPPLGVSLLIECKKSQKIGWVFHTRHKGSGLLPFLGTFVDFLKRVENFPDVEFPNMTAAQMMASKLSGLHLFDNRIKIGILNANLYPKEKDEFFEAANQILSALEGMRDSMKSFVVFPTIVFDGDMFEFHQENDETKVIPISHVQFLSYQKAPAGMLPCLIDVVRKPHFSEFLKMIERDFQILTEIAERGTRSHE